MGPHEQSAQHEQPSNPTILTVSMGQESLVAIVADEDKVDESHEDRFTLSADTQSIEEPVSVRKSEEAEKETVVQVEPNIIEGPTEDCVSLGIDDTLQVNPEAIEEHTDRQSLVGAENDGPLQTVPQTTNIYTVDRTSVDVDHDDTVQIEPVAIVNPSDNDTPSDIVGVEPATTSVTRVRATAQKSKVPRRVRPHVFMHRFQCLEEDHAERVRVLEFRMIKEKRVQTRNYQQAVADCVVEAQGGMIGLEIDERAEEQIRALQSTEAAISQPARADSATDDGDRMDGLEFQVPIVAGLGEMMEVTDAPPDQQTADDTVDEVMIGSDVDGEMEVDSDEDSGVNDGDQMDVREEGLKLDSTIAGSSHQASNAGNSTQATIAGPSDPMDIAPQCIPGKVNKEKLQDRLRREQEKLALRQTSTQVSSSGETTLVSSSVVAQPSQQQPAAESETGNVAISMLPRVAENIESSNSASELREARLGKRAESRVVQEEVVSPEILASSQSISASVSIASSPVGDSKEHGNKSDTSESTTTPTSTEPSSTSSTVPSSPIPIILASIHDGSPKPASVTGEASAPKKRNSKRDCDSLDESRDDEKSPGKVENEKANQADQNIPGSGLPKVSLTRSVLPAKTVKRKLDVNGTQVGKVVDHHTPTSPASQPTKDSAGTEDSPAESSKKARNAPPPPKTNTVSEDVAPLSEIPDNRGRKFSPPKQVLSYAFMV